MFEATGGFRWVGEAIRIIQKNILWFSELVGIILPKKNDIKHPVVDMHVHGYNIINIYIYYVQYIYII